MFHREDAICPAQPLDWLPLEGPEMSMPGPPSCDLEKQGRGVEAGKLDARGLPGGVQGIAVGSSDQLLQGVTLKTVVSAQAALAKRGL